MIPVFLILFILFLIIFNYYQNKSAQRQENAERAFWERERRANLTRKQDISQLAYLTLSRDLIPGTLHTQAEESLLELCDTRMIDLSSYTNTDLKLQYGAANLQTLTDCEERYMRMIRQIPVYAQELIDAGNTEAARTLLVFGQNSGANAQIYTVLLDALEG